MTPIFARPGSFQRNSSFRIVDFSKAQRFWSWAPEPQASSESLLRKSEPSGSTWQTSGIKRLVFYIWYHENRNFICTFQLTQILRRNIEQNGVGDIAQIRVCWQLLNDGVTDGRSPIVRVRRENDIWKKKSCEKDAPHQVVIVGYVSEFF